MSVEQGEKTIKMDEQVGLLFGYHKEMYKDAFEKPTFREQCCAVYCARNSITSWAFAFSTCLILIGTLATLYGYFLPSLYLSWTPDINSNLTMTTSRANSRIEREAKSLKDIYHDRDIFVIVGLSILFVGGVVLSLALLVPLCVAEWGIEQIPSSSRISVKSEFHQGNDRRTENCTEPHKEQEF